jgi:manganese-transporting P-type ATPase
MRLKGVRVFDPSKAESTATSDEDSLLVHPAENEIPWPTVRVMVVCHSLASANIPRDGKMKTNAKPFINSSSTQVIGDPLELAVVREMGYHLMGNGIVAPKAKSESQEQGIVPNPNHKPISILHRFAFSSKLKRMTVLCTEGDSSGIVWAVTKGAPETVKGLLTVDTIPLDYDEVAFYHMSRGRRVLSMAYREIGHMRGLQGFKDKGRYTIECELRFAGFLVLDCPLKSDSKSIVSELKKSGLGVVMITGDAILTAAEVARQVGIIRRPKNVQHTVYEIIKKKDMAADDEKVNHDPLFYLECVPLGHRISTSNGAAATASLELSQNNMRNLLRMSQENEAAFCMSGDVLVGLATIALQLYQSSSKSPAANSRSVPLDEKAILMSAPAQNILQTLAPLISVFARHAPHQKEAVVAALNHGGHQTLMCGDGTNDVGALKRAHVGISIISAPTVEKKQREATATIVKMKVNEKKDRKTTKKATTASARVSVIEESMRQLHQAQQELDQVELGDASVAAPFTSRAVSIKCCKDVIQQGRCTLVTMLQIYKILGINCLVNAFVLSELFLHGAKQGDRQLTIFGFAVAALFFFVTRAEPLPTLSPLQPPSSVLCSEALISIAGQCLIHIAGILIGTECALSYVDPYDPSLVPDGPFNPNVLNTCTFLLTCVSTSKSCVSPRWCFCNCHVLILLVLFPH